MTGHSSFVARNRSIIQGADLDGCLMTVTSTSIQVAWTLEASGDMVRQNLIASNMCVYVLGDDTNISERHLRALMLVRASEEAARFCRRLLSVI